MVATGFEPQVSGQNGGYSHPHPTEHVFVDRVQVPVEMFPVHRHDPLHGESVVVVVVLV